MPCPIANDNKISFGLTLILDGRISEDSAVDLGDIITDEEEIIEELIKRGTVHLTITQDWLKT